MGRQRNKLDITCHLNIFAFFVPGAKGTEMSTETTNSLVTKNLVQNTPLRKPRMNDIQVGQITTSLLSYPTILVAFELGLFSFLSEKPASIAEVCASLSLHQRTAQVILSICTAAGFVQLLPDGLYALTEVSEDYLLPSSPTNWCGYLNFLIQNAFIFSYDTIKKTLISNQPQIHNGQNLFEINKKDKKEALGFANWMHSVSMGPALDWVEAEDLSGAHHFLDIGGGSAAHSIAVALKWQKLRVTVFEMKEVCEIANTFILDQNLHERVAVHAGDMWKSSFPDADIHFYSQIFHDWSPEECFTLAKKSFSSLTPGGKIIIHELLFNDTMTGPLRVASVSLMLCLLYPHGRQYSGIDLIKILKDAGFIEVEKKITSGYWGIVTGKKPKH